MIDLGSRRGILKAEDVFRKASEAISDHEPRGALESAIHYDAAEAADPRCC